MKYLLVHGGVSTKLGKSSQVLPSGLYIPVKVGPIRRTNVDAALASSTPLGTRLTNTAPMISTTSSGTKPAFAAPPQRLLHCRLSTLSLMNLPCHLSVHCAIFINASGLAYRLTSRYPSLEQLVFKQARRYGDTVTWRLRKLTNKPVFGPDSGSATSPLVAGIVAGYRNVNWVLNIVPPLPYKSSSPAPK